MGVHVETGCGNYSSLSSLSAAYTTQLSGFGAKYSGLPSQRVDRTHCYVWSDWDSVPKVDALNGIRINYNYEWYPSTWTASNTGYLTGSGLSMRFTDTTGSMIDTYQGVTDLDYETDPTATTINADLDNTIGSNAFYGVIGTHYDTTGSSYYQLLINAATSRHIPMISADQLATWKDALGSSTFAGITSTDSSLDFTVQVATGGEGMQAMVPLSSGAGSLSSLKQGSNDVSYTASTVKGVQYAVFDANPGAYKATYGTATPGSPTSSSSGQAASPTPSTKKPGKLIATKSTLASSDPAIASVTSPTPFTNTDNSTGSNNTPTPTTAATTPATSGGISSTVVKYAAAGLLVMTLIGAGWGIWALRRKHMIYPS
jgi:hypothetical protein